MLQQRTSDLVAGSATAMLTWLVTGRVGVRPPARKDVVAEARDSILELERDEDRKVP